MKQNLRFGLDLGRLALLKISGINLNYATFEVSVLMFSWANQMKSRLSVHCSVSTKNLDNLKVTTINLYAKIQI